MNSVYYLWLFCNLNVIFSPVMAIPGNYVTFPILKDKRLPDPIESIDKIVNLKTCKDLCVRHLKCEAYSYSEFGRVCQLYKLKLGTPVVISPNYNLYVRAKTEAEGYYVYKTNYIKLIRQRMKFFDASDYCEDKNGMLVAVRDDELNNLLTQLMTKRSIFHAFIGLNDVKAEGKWMYMDKGAVMNSKWAYDGMWYRREKNCAVIRIDGLWYQENCKNPQYFFCQIPMF